MANIVPAAAGYFVLNWKYGYRIPIVGWKNELSDWNQCQPMLPGNDNWPDTPFNAIESPDGSVYDVDTGDSFDSRKDWHAFKVEAAEQTADHLAKSA